MFVFMQSRTLAQAAMLFVFSGISSLVCLGSTAPSIPNGAYEVSHEESEQVGGTWKQPGLTTFNGSDKQSAVETESVQVVRTEERQKSPLQAASPMVRHEKQDPKPSAGDNEGKALSIADMFPWWSDVFLGPEMLMLILLLPVAFITAKERTKTASMVSPGKLSGAKRSQGEARSERGGKAAEATRGQQGAESRPTNKADTEDTRDALSPEEEARLAHLTDAFHAHVRGGDLEAASAAMAKLEAEGKPGLPDYNAIISLCARTNNPRGAHEWLDRVEKHGLTANSVCYNAVINAHAKRGDLKEAVAIAKRMLDKNVPLDTVSYNTIIDACGRAGNAISADWWMKSMLANGVKASVVSFGSVMLACARGGKPDWLQVWLEQADQLGIELNMICFSAVINAFAKSGDLTSALQWLDVMKKRKVQPSIHCFTGMLELVLKTEDFEGADNLIEKMRGSGVEPDAAMFNWLVTSCSRAGQSDRAKRWAAEAVAAGCKLNRTARRAAGPDIPLVETAASSCAAGAGSPAQAEEEESTVILEAPTDAKTEDYVGQRFVGTIKEYIAAKFGYIKCDETYAFFKRDVFLSSNDNPHGYAKGQRVTFKLFLDPKRGLPRATDVKVYTRPNSQVPR